MNTFIIREGVLNDDTLYVADEHHVFKGNIVALLEYHTFANEWGNHHHRKGFKSMDAVYKYLAKNYPEFTDEVYQA